MTVSAVEGHRSLWLNEVSSLQGDHYVVTPGQYDEIVRHMQADDGRKRSYGHITCDPTGNVVFAEPFGIDPMWWMTALKNSMDGTDEKVF